MYRRPFTGQSALMNVLTRTVEKAGQILKRDFEEIQNMQVSASHVKKFAHIAEKNVIEFLMKELTTVRPKFGVYGEGCPGKESEDGHRWIIDPLDGTNNFSHGIPHFAISVAVEKEGELVAGIVFDVFHDELYVAEKGTGCFLNGKRLRVSGRTNPNTALMVTGFHMHGSVENQLEQIQDRLKPALKITPHIASFRSFGATALDLAYVAAGRFDGAWFQKSNLWDIAAGIILIREAGGFVTDFAGKHDADLTGDLIATNPKLHKTFLGYLA